MDVNGEGLHPDRGMILSGSQPPQPDVLALTARWLRTKKLRTAPPAPVETKFLLCTQRYSPHLPRFTAGKNLVLQRPYASSLPNSSFYLSANPLWHRTIAVG
jgi:hypothetical protein